ncbi:MAG: PAS domain-containing sensor histidine kinase [Sphingobacteriaceae bacterium]|nr:MAG: PAS domain-containing sensor histidine kinase [Sphingobacteriaceae bacterium]
MPKKSLNKPVSNKSFDEKLFRLLVAQVKDHAIFMIDPNGYILSWNEGAKHIKGYTENEIIGKHISVFYTPEDVQNNEPRKNLNLALKNGIHEVEGWRVRKDGAEFWANIVFTTLYNDEGHLTGFAKVTRDITDEKKISDRKTRLNAELEQQVIENTEKLVANENRFRQLIENSYDGISLMDENLKVIFRSKSSQRINGWTNTERDSLSIIDLAHPDDRELLKNLIEKILNNPGVPVIATYRSRHKQGHYIWIECVYTNMLSDVNINAIVCNFRDVTERKAKDEEIKKKTAQVESILESINEGFIALDKNLCYTYVNKRVCEMVNREPDELLGQYIWSLFPEAINTPTFNAYAKALKEQKHVHFEDYYEPLDLWHENDIYPSENGISIFTRDITERKKAEAEIEKSHAQLLEASATQAAILDALPPNIVLVNEKGKIIAVNESWKKFTLDNNLGVPQFGIGYNYLAIAETATGVDKPTNNKIARGLKDVIVGNKKEFTSEYECYISNKKVWYQVIIAPLADTNHKGAVILHIDITDRKIAEEALIQSEANLRSVFENTGLIIVLFDNDLNILSFNTNAKEKGRINFGKKLKIGASAFNYFPKERKAIIQQIVQKVHNCQETVCYETSYFINENIIWYEVRWICVVNKANESIGVILTLNDITDKKRSELERDRMTADLVQRNKDLEQFTYIVSHNLRAPVANIRGLSNLLNGFGAGDEADNAAALQGLSYSVNNLDKVIIDLNNILQIGKQVNDQIETISLSDLVEEIKSGIHEMIRKNKASITYNFEALDELYTVKVYMYSIFQNLVINSIKFKQPGVNPQIEISSAIVDKNIILRFKDNGKGIDLAKNTPHLFGLYKRFDTSVEGKGMGLFMVKLQTESLGGTVNVNSEVNKGTEFTLEFPMKLKKNKIVPDAKL